MFGFWDVEARDKGTAVTNAITIFWGTKPFDRQGARRSTILEKTNGSATLISPCLHVKNLRESAHSVADLFLS